MRSVDPSQYNKTTHNDICKNGNEARRIVQVNVDGRKPLGDIFRRVTDANSVRITVYNTIQRVCGEWAWPQTIHIFSSFRFSCGILYEQNEPLHAESVWREWVTRTRSLTHTHRLAASSTHSHLRAHPHTPSLSHALTHASTSWPSIPSQGSTGLPADRSE